MEIGPRETGDMDVSTESKRVSEKERRVTDMDPPHLKLLQQFECT